MEADTCVGEGHTKWLGGPDCGPQAICCIPMSGILAVDVVAVMTQSTSSPIETEQIGALYTTHHFNHPL